MRIDPIKSSSSLNTTSNSTPLLEKKAAPLVQDSIESASTPWCASVIENICGYIGSFFSSLYRFLCCCFFKSPTPEPTQPPEKASEGPSPPPAVSKSPATATQPKPTRPSTSARQKMSSSSTTPILTMPGASARSKVSGSSTTPIFTSPIISAPSLPSTAPIGVNAEGGSNCCFNAVAQGLVHIPSWRKAVENHPICKRLIADYEATKGSEVRSDFAQALRKEFDQREKTPRWEKNKHEDAQEILALLFNCSASPPEYKGWKANGEERSDSFIPLHIADNEKHSLTDLFDDYFIEDTIENQKTVKGGSRFHFALPPPEFLFYSATAALGSAKNCNPLEGEIRTLFLSKEKTLCEQEARYTCDFFIEHRGMQSRRGHYVSGIKIAGQWYHMDDGHVAMISEAEAERSMRSSCLLHYKLI